MITEQEFQSILIQFFDNFTPSLY